MSESTALVLNSRRLGRFTAALLALLLVGGCGGGGGGGGSSASLQLLADGTGSTTGVVGQPVGEVPGVRLVDASGAPVAGVTVSFRVAQAGASVTPTSVVTGADGRARPTSWVLGTVAGANSLVATAPGAPGEVRFIATAEAGQPASLAAASIQQQIGDISRPVDQPPAVIVADAFGNRVTGTAVGFSVVQGGGSITGAPAVTDTNGIAQLESWTLGAQEGLNEVRASLGGAGSVSFTAEGYPPLELSIDGVQLNQATQTGSGDIPAVAGREGLLRVIVTASRPNTARPDVRLRLFRDGVQLWERTIPARTTSVPLEPLLSALSLTWNIELTPEEVQPGLAVEAVVDPAGELDLAARENTRFPRGTGQAPITVQQLAPLQVVFVPVEATRYDLTGQVSPDNVDEFLAATRKWLPVSAIERRVRTAPFVTDRDLTDINEVEGLLVDLRALRTLESENFEYYHGIVPNVPDIAVAGIAYVPDRPWFTPARVGLSYDPLPRASETVAHELGHNLGRFHAPCGDLDDPDPSFPYGDGGIGVPGYDIDEDSLRGPVGYFDYMSYCRPRWTSDYTYRDILTWRLDDPIGVSGEDSVLADGAAPTSGLLLWGQVGSQGVVLNPAFELEARPVLPDSDGPNQLRGVAANGEVLFDLAFTGETAPHAADPTARHFSWFVPLTSGQVAALDRIELITPQGVALQAAGRGLSAGLAAEAAAASAGVERLAGGGLRLSWDVESSPVALVRDRRSGQVVGIGRSGELRLGAGTAAAIEPELILSDGLRTRHAIFEDER